MSVDILFMIAVLAASVIIHEVSHGYTAEMLGDPTARLAGRLTLNPLPHIDIVGSLIVPLFLVLTHSPLLFGWAKPVPINFYNLKNQTWGPALVGASGALANLFLAIFFGLLLRFLPETGIFSPAFFALIKMIVLLNILLAVFNMIPVPPLDGSKVLFALLPYRLRFLEEFLERYWIVFLALVLLLGGSIVVPAVNVLFRFITGA